MLEVGSSSISNFGCKIQARAMASRCLSPPDKLLALACNSEPSCAIQLLGQFYALAGLCVARGSIRTRKTIGSAVRRNTKG